MAESNDLRCFKNSNIILVILLFYETESIVSVQSLKLALF